MALPNGDLITTVFDPQMAYPVDKRMQVDTLNSRDSISMFIRWEGMTVYVLEDSKIYILQGGRSNEYWKELGTGSGTGGTTFVGQFATADLLPTSGRSPGDYAFVGTGDDFVQYNWDNISGQWVMAEGQTDMASEFFHIGYKTDLRRPVIFPLFPKDVLVETGGDFVFAPATAVARFIFTGVVDAVRGIETAAADREIKLVNRTGSDIPLRDKASGIPAGSGFDFGGSDYTWINGSEITLKGNGTYWELAPNNQVAFSDHLDSVNTQVSVGSDGLMVVTGINDTYTGEIVSFKEIDYIPSIADGIIFTTIDGINVKRFVKSINYAMFGAKGDGVNDDAVQIKLAHQVANLLNLPIINEDGEYWLINPNEIIIQTSVSWGKTVFHIDESKNSAVPRFLVKRSSEPFNITLTSPQKASVISKINNLSGTISELNQYSNHIIIVSDENDRVGIRNGIGTGNAKTEFFALGEGGRVLTENYWKFTDYTSIQGISIDDDLIIDGGSFTLNGQANSSLPASYVYNGFLINRSNAIIRNQSVKYDGTDNTNQYLNGFYYFSQTYNSYLENVSLPPRKNTSAGTYAIGANTTISTRLINVSSEGSEEFSASVGTNNMKDFSIENCKLNRVDVHFNAHNITVLRSKIGFNGIHLNGHGLLRMEDVTVKNVIAVTFREDYGGTWDGDIIIKRLTQYIRLDTFASVFSWGTTINNVSLPLVLARSIELEDITFDYSQFPSSTQTATPVYFGTISRDGDDNRYVLPSRITMNNIRIIGRTNGFRIFTFNSVFGDFKCDDSGFVDGDFIEPNINIDINGIDAISSSSIFCNETITYTDSMSPVVEFSLQNTNEIDLLLRAIKGKFDFYGMTINGLTTTHQGIVAFYSCDMIPKRTWVVQNRKYIKYINTTWHQPIISGTPLTDVTQINTRYSSTINLNASVRGGHSNSILSDGMLTVFTPRPEFLEMLKNHDREENELIVLWYGTTGQRPSSPPFIGFHFFDTTIESVVWWDGSSWVSLPLPNASTTQRGIIEQATDAETITGTDTEKAISPANLQAKFDAFATYGTYIPIINSSGTNPTLTYTTQYGAWRKIGRLMQFEVRLEWIAITGAGTGSIGISLPSGRDISESNNATIGGLSIGLCSGITVTNGITATFLGSATGVRFYDYDGVIIPVTALKEAGILLISGSYRTSS